MFRLIPTDKAPEEVVRIGPSDVHLSSYFSSEESGLIRNAEIYRSEDLGYMVIAMELGRFVGTMYYDDEKTAESAAEDWVFGSQG